MQNLSTDIRGLNQIVFPFDSRVELPRAVA